MMMMIITCLRRFLVPSLGLGIGLPASVYGLLWTYVGQNPKTFVKLRGDEMRAVIQNRWKPKTEAAQEWLSGLVSNLANWVPKVSPPTTEIGGGTAPTPEPPTGNDPTPEPPSTSNPPPTTDPPSTSDPPTTNPPPTGEGETEDGSDEDTEEQGEYLLLKRRIPPPVSRPRTPKSLKVLFANHRRGLLECKEELSGVNEQLKAIQAELQSTKDALKRAKGKEPASDPKPEPGDAKKDAKITELKKALKTCQSDLKGTRKTLDDTLKSIGKGTGTGNGKGNTAIAKLLQQCQEDLIRGKKQMQELDNEIESQIGIWSQRTTP
jgi:hypothetical protein